MKPITAKQVALLHALFSKASIWGEARQLDWLLDQGVNVDKIEDVPVASLPVLVQKLKRLAG